MEEIPEIIKCKVTVHGKLANGILLRATFKMLKKNSYIFLFGPTDKHGTASLAKANIISNANETLELALMDYHSIEDWFSGEITIDAMSEDDIRKAINAFKIYHPVSPYPKGYESMLKTALNNPFLHDFDAIHVMRTE